MAETSIEWSNLVWNCVRGCRRVSPGCGDASGGGCYAERMAHRFSGPGLPYEDLTKMTKFGPRWTGEARFIPEKLAEPLSWKKPARVFVNSMSDLFHDDISNEQIAAVFGVMAACPHLTFQVLTKRAERMLEWFQEIHQVVHDRPDATCLRIAQRELGRVLPTALPGWPLPNVWLGVSTENQRTADERIPLLLSCEAAVHWISAEPLLGPIDLMRLPCNVEAISGTGWHDYFSAVSGLGYDPEAQAWGDEAYEPRYPRLDWVVTGADSGPGARPMSEAWVRSLRDQCEHAGVSFFYKQKLERRKKVSLPMLDGRPWAEFPEAVR